MLLVRRFAIVLATIVTAVSIAAPVAASAPATAVVTTLRAAGHTAQPSRVGFSPPPCSDRAYRLLGARWPTAYAWSFKKSGTPGDLSKSAVAGVLQRSFANVTGARNDCGRGDRVSASSHYLGTTSRSPSCNSRDGFNVVGFASLPRGVLAVTCYWFNGKRIIEADMRITTRESWALSTQTCHANMPLLEATITHEAGHVFGLDHVGERRHGRLTMSPYIDGACDNNESTLGLGDLLGLEALY